MLQDVPAELKSDTNTRGENTRGEASLRGHLIGDIGKEQTGSQSYVPPDPKDDKALRGAEDLLRGLQPASSVRDAVTDSTK